jgi:RNA polymerase sigma factor (sigma-70 family)
MKLIDHPQPEARDATAAFEDLVQQHSGWIYAAALRRSGDMHLAEDVTQAVFIVLWQRWRQLPHGTPLAPWLFRVMSYALSNAMRHEQRRRRRERTAAAMRPLLDPSPSSDSRGVSLDIDEQLAHLKRRDREAILLRYYEGQSFAEMGRGLGIGEDAARKRVDRAIAKLRARFARRGSQLSATALGGALAANAAAPARTVALTSPSANAVALAADVSRLLAATKVKLAAALASVGVGIGALLWLAQRPAIPANVAPAPPTNLALAPIRVTEKHIAGANIPSPWPLALPGSITGPPVVADLEGNGKLSLIVPCETLADATLIHPTPQEAVLLYAFRADGTSVPGWPVTLISATQRIELERGNRTESWSSSPSVCRDRAGKTRIVITTPYFQGFRIITPDGKCREAHGGSQWASVPLLDIDGDGVTDIIAGAGILNIDRGSVRGFGPDHPIASLSGYAPCIGDADGDGKPEIYHLFADTIADLQSGSGGYANENADIMAYDRTGAPVAGWPCAIGKGQLDAYPPVMGDVAGDAKMEIVATDRQAVYAWTCDGKPLLSDGVEGAFKSNVAPSNASPTLADLDGDGKAEIIVFDSAINAIRAWHGDGRGVTLSDGVIAKLPMQCFGVSVADLGGDGVIDLFAGTYWIKFDPRTKAATLTNMLSADAETNTTQPTIADLDGDGQADVIFGLKNGCVVVYQTHLAYKPQWAQWPTAHGNFQHTGASTPPR